MSAADFNWTLTSCVGTTLRLAFGFLPLRRMERMDPDMIKLNDPADPFWGNRKNP